MAPVVVASLQYPFRKSTSCAQSWFEDGIGACRGRIVCKPAVTIGHVFIEL